MAGVEEEPFLNHALPSHRAFIRRRVLINIEGEVRVPEDVSRIARISFSSLSRGLALQYDRRSDQQKSDLALLIARASTWAQSDEDNASLDVLDCIAEAGVGARNSKACISGAVKRQKKGSEGHAGS